MLVASAIFPLVAAKTPVPNVQVTLRGKKYDLEDVTTVEELQERLAEASGVDASQQGRVLFNGKRLAASECLSEVGVSQGDQLNVVPGKSKSKSKKSSSTSGGSAAGSATDEVPSADAVKDMLKSSGVDTSKLDDLMKGMGGANGEAPNLQESMEMMSGMMNSPIFKEYMSDPERLEQSRQMILQNPMLKSMMAGMPGMEDILNSPEAWREAMQAAASMYQSMDQDDLMKAMMGGPPGGVGMDEMGGMGGLFGSEAGPSALDELSEDDE